MTAANSMSTATNFGEHIISVTVDGVRAPRGPTTTTKITRVNHHAVGRRLAVQDEPIHTGRTSGCTNDTVATSCAGSSLASLPLSPDEPAQSRWRQNALGGRPADVVTARTVCSDGDGAPITHYRHRGWTHHRYRWRSVLTCTTQWRCFTNDRLACRYVLSVRIFLDTRLSRTDHGSRGSPAKIYDSSKLRRRRGRWRRAGGRRYIRRDDGSHTTGRQDRGRAGWPVYVRAPNIIFRVVRYVQWYRCRRCCRCWAADDKRRCSGGTATLPATQSPSRARTAPVLL